MIHHGFPDLHWLKRKIDERFRSRTGWNDIPLEAEGFPSVVIRASSREAWRPDIAGPISLFLNLRGRSRCGVDGRIQEVPEEYFFLSNRFQPYTLEIDSRQPVETFNIHIGEAFSEGVLSALLTPADTILNNGPQQKAVTVAFQNRLYRRDAAFESLVQDLQSADEPGGVNRPRFEEALTGLLHYLLAQHRDTLEQLHRLPALKTVTRIEVYKRLSASLDYLHSTGDADGEMLARIACLSRFHYLRLFRQAYGCTPYQYAQRLRLEKACQLLRHSDLSVADIGFALGFENPQSFSRLFAQRHRLYPAQYRAAAK
ncbi:helix-turn-helix transcriptional regulator [Flaviaesturariibacter amylovorans]|uniref:HTH araC/xylS-type domain-containing protein n=1 Tax=Flaviaesturariibacter amylovorans TaxID=1084520 RepID=A0ABP8HGE7_9BACT